MTNPDPSTASLHLWYGDGPGSPRTSPTEVLAAAGVTGVDACVTLGWTIERQPWIEQLPFTIRTTMAGYGLGRAVNDGRITPLPVRLSAVASMIEENPPEVAVVTAVRRGDRYAFGSSVGWGDVLARTARKLVIEVDDEGPDLGAPLIEGRIVATVPRPPAPDTPPADSRPADDIDLRIGALVTSLLPDEVTLQFGPGGVGEGIARSLDRPVHIRSGLVTDAMAEIHERGLLLSPVVAAYAWGGRGVSALAQAGMLRLASCTETHDMSAISATPRFVGCNTAVQFGLDGAVNVERVRGRIIAAVGGHSDFCAGASRSIGGLSIIAVRSTTATGESTIVAEVEQVSTQRSDIDVLVTEHGIADLRNVNDRVRAERIIAVAAPEHREALRAAGASR